MKSKIVMLSLSLVTVLSIALFSCSKEELTNETSVSSGSSNLANARTVGGEDGYIDEKPIVRLKWEGVFNPNGSPCAGGECGKCAGICVKIKFLTYDAGVGLTEEQIAAGDGTCSVKLDQTNNQLIMVPDVQGAFDNGDGTCTITEDFDIGSFATHFGVSKVTIKQGTYNITYSSDFPNGRCAFDVAIVQ